MDCSSLRKFLDLTRRVCAEDLERALADRQFTAADVRAAIVYAITEDLYFAVGPLQRYLEDQYPNEASRLLSDVRTHGISDETIATFQDEVRKYQGRRTIEIDPDLQDRDVISIP